MLQTRIKELRIQKKISQSELGKILNLSQQAIAKWEKGNAEPDSENIIKLSEVFNVDSNYLLGITDDPTPLKIKQNITIEKFLEQQGITNEEYIKSLKGIINLMKNAELNEKE